MGIQLQPEAGAVAGDACPMTVMSWDGDALAVTDAATGQSLRLTPATLYSYTYDQHITVSFNNTEWRPVHGLAVLDADGLVMLDLPGSWQFEHLADFAEHAGIPLVDARADSFNEVRTVLAARAPGWRRLRGLTPPSPARYRKPLAVGVGVAGLAVMVYLASTGMWMAWRGISTVGRVLLDVLEVKWLAVAFSPVLLFLSPVSSRIRRWRADRGLILGSTGGAHLSVRSDEKIRIGRGKESTLDIEIGERAGDASSLLLYRYEDLTGLFILDNRGEPVHHLPGHWLPDAVNRFASRHELPLAMHSISREEYLTLARACRSATP
ncbi:hypothetical protein [Nonomuraea rhizosphaerae]|uniref:hypothetical protein n=1 Tax=Nonomuraea rhizosphaerae TaxID=2665663 RepID=UPI001C5CCE31|nr:hypothetical protein [Nonomuraea rhizosphaerae]